MWVSENLWSSMSPTQTNFLSFFLSFLLTLALTFFPLGNFRLIFESFKALLLTLTFLPFFPSLGSSLDFSFLSSLKTSLFFLAYIIVKILNINTKSVFLDIYRKSQKIHYIENF